MPAGGSTQVLSVNSAGTGANAIDINATAGGIDIDANSGFTLDATTISIDGTDDSNVTVTNSGKDLTLAVAGGGTQVLSVNSAGTGTNAIDINATAGGIDIDASGVLALDGASGIDIGKTSDVAIDIDASTLDIDTSAGAHLILQLYLLMAQMILI